MKRLARDFLALTLLGLIAFGLWAVLFPESFKRIGFPVMVISPIPPVP